VQTCKYKLESQFMKSLQEHFQDKYPELKEKMILVATSDSITIEIPFLNPRYTAWIEKDKQGYIVGINFLHNHFDLDTDEKNMEDAFESLDDILKDKIVAVGLKNRTDDYMIKAVMPLDIGIAEFSKKKNEYEIVSFSKEY
jgi:hypothetical protein